MLTRPASSHTDTQIDSMPVQTDMKEEKVVAADTCALWADGGEFAAHVAAVKKALGPDRVRLVANATKGEEIVKQLAGQPGLKVEQRVINKDRDTALQFKEQGNDLFRWEEGEDACKCLKGAVSRDFRLQFFCINRTHLGP